MAAEDNACRGRPLARKQTSVRRRIVTILATIAAIYCALCVLLYLTQSRLVYFPFREIEGTPRSLGLNYEEVKLRASDGVELSAWFIPRERARGTVLFCHGNAGNISHRLGVISMFHELGFAMLIFDYRGYGASQGSPTERGTYLDAEAAWNHLTNERKVPPQRIVLFGESLGGAVAAWLAKERTPGALVLQSTFTSLPDIGARLYWWLPVRLLSRFRYDARSHVRQAKCPVLVAHSPQDEIVPYALGRQLFEAANEPKEFLQLSGSHNDGLLPSDAAAIDAFLAKHLAQ
ncbi:MAG: alpha/beta hydrolase [Planctomycetes bacterium]|nr:alpha/beta hydrolase [Planctomycetota bacterium]